MRLKATHSFSDSLCETFDDLKQIVFLGLGCSCCRREGGRRVRRRRSVRNYILDDEESLIDSTKGGKRRGKRRTGSQKGASSSSESEGDMNMDIDNSSLEEGGMMMQKFDDYSGEDGDAEEERGRVCCSLQCGRTKFPPLRFCSCCDPCCFESERMDCGYDLCCQCDGCLNFNFNLECYSCRCVRDYLFCGLCCGRGGRGSGNSYQLMDASLDEQEPTDLLDIDAVEESGENNANEEGLNANSVEERKSPQNSSADQEKERQDNAANYQNLQNQRQQQQQPVQREAEQLKNTSGTSISSTDPNVALLSSVSSFISSETHSSALIDNDTPDLVELNSSSSFTNTSHGLDSSSAENSADTRIVDKPKTVESNTHRKKNGKKSKNTNEANTKNVTEFTSSY
eukprot:MONOS_2214.1-p1 / transcript=MONOS_2214.1 / gene=MONOS_2214 / organism=Monocercomonoides_exilis_PA203 / gene_product=unspecified product / transcript_product=unspecified product / location=Mono_scaffold00044:69985-71178(-) / protein_length=398 / sequence_SO=supercontig / SO=protein_coding / is_pseudo=false